MEDLGTIVEELAVDEYRAGAVHRARLHLIEDGAGYPVLLPIVIARGKKPGPTLGIMAALHGDEVNGIPVIHKIFGSLDPNRLAGTVIGVLVASYPAFDRHQRRFIDGTDLNHIMPGAAAGNASGVYAHRLVDRVVSKFDYLVDLHTASRGRWNSLYARVNMSKEVSAKMAVLLRPQIILHNPPRDGTLRGEASNLGIPSVTMEIGNPSRFQPEYIRSTVRGLRAVMGHLGMTKSRPAAEGKEPIICERSFWTYTDRGGLLSVHPKLAELVAEGDSIATLTNVFGDVTAEYRAPQDGVIIGKAANPVGHTGARIAHIGVLASAETRRKLAAGEATGDSGARP